MNELDEYNEDEDDHDYWNSYGSQDDDSTSLGDERLASTKDSDAGTEDAYWARYSSVHAPMSSFELPVLNVFFSLMFVTV